MMLKRVLCFAVAVSVVAPFGFAQVARAGGGRVTYSGEGDLRGLPPSLDMLIHMSVLVVDGTVTDVLPAVETGPNPDIPSVETYSVVTVSEVLSAVAVAKPSSLYVVQIGGKAGKWQVDTPDSPLLQKGDRYLLFLDPDGRAARFYDAGTPRYNATDGWAGFAKIKNAKVGFLPDAPPAFHQYDNMAADAFLALVRRRVDAIVPKDQIILSHQGYDVPLDAQKQMRAKP
jgi:hypothetical protein